MSAGGSGAIGPVSVRYAAQIRELLFAQAMQRIAADQEAARARADAERAARVEAAASTEGARQPLGARITETDKERSAAGAAPADPARGAASPTAAPSQHIVDIQA